MPQGIIYVLTNAAMEGFVKVGRTQNLDDRLKSLYNSSVPFRFTVKRLLKSKICMKLKKLYMIF